MRNEKLLTKAKEWYPIGFTTKCEFAGTVDVIKSHEFVLTEWGDIWLDAGETNTLVYDGETKKWAEPHAKKKRPPSKEIA